MLECVFGDLKMFRFFRKKAVGEYLPTGYEIVYKYNSTPSLVVFTKKEKSNGYRNVMDGK